MRLYKTRNILGVRVADVTLKTIVPIIQKLIESPGKKVFFGANARNINLYFSNKEFKRAIDDASLIYPEGIAAIIASRLLGNPLQEKTTLMDFLYRVFSLAEKKKWPIYILGGKQEAINKVAVRLKKDFPELMVNAHHGFFPVSKTKDIIKDINKTNSKMLFVAMGSPKQEIWIHNNLDWLDAHVFFGIGGSIDIVAGIVPRAPTWMRKIGLEWLHRSFKEPVRLLIRTINDNYIFILRLTCEFLNIYINNTNKLWFIKRPNLKK